MPSLRTRRLLATLGLLSLFLGSCSKTPPVSELPKPPEIAAGGGGSGAVDLGFAINSVETLPDGSQTVYAVGVYHGHDVGFGLVLGPEWKKDDSQGPVAAYHGTVTFRSIGPPSGALLEALDDLYGTNLKPAAMRPTTVFTAVSLEGEPANLAKGATKIKLSSAAGAPDRAAELFTDIDLAKGVVNLREKNPAFRAAVIRCLQPE